MIPRDGIVPGKQQLDANLKEVKEVLEHTYEAEPQVLTGFGGSANEAPFTTGQSMVPKVKGEPIPSPRPGKQPVFHVKVTARPIRNLQPGKKLTYSITGGPVQNKSSGQTVTQRITSHDGNTVHCIPELAETGEPLSQVNSTPLTSPKSSHRSAYKDQLSGLSGLEEGTVGALVHAYKGESALKTETVMSGLLSNANAIQAAPTEQTVRATQPNNPAKGRDPHVPAAIAKMRAEQQRREDPPEPAPRQWWDASSKSLEHMTAQERAKALEEYQNIARYKALQYGKQSTIEQNDLPEKKPKGEGLNSAAYTLKDGQTYSKVIPGLVDSADEDRQTVYNWIVPDENAADTFAHLDSAMSEGLTDQHLDRVPFQRGNTSNIMNLMNRTRDERAEDQPTKRAFSWKSLIGLGGSNDAVQPGRRGGTTKDWHPEDWSPRSANDPPLHFQDSTHLAEFLNRANEGMIWEHRGDERDELKKDAARRGSVSHQSVRSKGYKYTDSTGDELKERGGCCEGGNSEDESEESDDAPLKPSIVYGGVEHDAPRYAGELNPLTMRLHATEIHQYIKVAGMPEPWIMTSKADPAHHAIHGPIALPWDPKYTGMPAPTLNDVRKHQCATIDLPPAVSQWFDPELPADYAAQEEDVRPELDNATAA